MAIPMKTARVALAKSPAIAALTCCAMAGGAWLSPAEPEPPLAACCAADAAADGGTPTPCSVLVRRLVKVS